MVRELELYNRLHIKPNATPQEIKRSFHQLSILYHPDKIGKETKQYTGIVEAHNILIDARTRRIYDQQGLAGLIGNAIDETDAGKCLTRKNRIEISPSRIVAGLLVAGVLVICISRRSTLPPSLIVQLAKDSPMM